MVGENRKALVLGSCLAAVCLAAAPALAQRAGAQPQRSPQAGSAPGAAQTAAQLAPGQSCAFVTQAHADESAGTPNINHDGTAISGTPLPDISRGFQGIPRSPQPPLTVSERRILECTYHLDEANADMPYTLFVPTTYAQGKPSALIVDLHGLNITPLQQILFDGTADYAERYGFIVVAPMGFNLGGWWGSRAGAAVDTAQTKPGTTTKYTVGELSEIDAMTLLRSIRARYTIDPDRIYLMGHSMGGAGTYYLGAKYNDIWAGIAPISGAGGIADAGAAERYKAFPTLLMHGDKDSIVPVATSRHSALMLQGVGAQHLYLEFPGKDHEFWIRRGAENMEKVFLFFSTVSKRTDKGPITPEMAAMPSRGAAPAGNGAAPGRNGAAPGRGR
jgi:dienelactone hydrolase